MLYEVITHRPKTPARPAGNCHQGTHRHGGNHSPALLAGERPAQAGCTDPHPGGGTLRRPAPVCAHQDCHHGTGVTTAGKGLRGRGVERRHAAKAAGANGRTPETGLAGYPGRHRCRRKSYNFV